MKNSDQPAFPISEEETDRIDTGVCIYTGVTKREYFAAMAMQGLCSNARIADIATGKMGKSVALEIAIKAENIADTVLRHLEPYNPKPE